MNWPQLQFGTSVLFLGRHRFPGAAEFQLCSLFWAFACWNIYNLPHLMTGVWSWILVWRRQHLGTNFSGALLELTLVSKPVYNLGIGIMVLHDCRPMPRYVVLFTVNAATVSGPPINFSGTVQYCTISSGCCKQVRCIAVKSNWGESHRTNWRRFQSKRIKWIWNHGRVSNLK